MVPHKILGSQCPRHVAEKEWFFLALSLTLHTAAVKDKLAGGVTSKSSGVEVVIASLASRGTNESP